MELSMEKVDNLSLLLKDLAENSDKTHEDLTAAILDDICIFFVPANTVHPLRNIVGSQENGFFLLSKAPVNDPEDSDKENSFTENGNLSDLNDENDEKRKLRFTKVRRVTVGSPISQELVYVSGSELFQPAGKKEIVKWFISCENLIPCSLKEARYLVSLYIQGLATSNLAYPLWVTCDAALPQQVAFMGALPQYTGGGIFVKNILVKEKGPFKSEDTLPISLEKASMEHLAASRSSVNSEVEMHGFAVYDLLGMESFNEDSQSSLIMEFQWEGVHALLETPPLSSNGILHIKVALGDMKSATYSMYSELKQLLNFSDGLKNQNPDWVKQSGDFVIDKVQDFLSEGQSMDTTKVEEKTPNKTLNDSDSALASPVSKMIDSEFARDNLDFTEKLWQLIRYSVDYDDMYESLRMIVTAFVQGDFQPVVHSANNTHLANYVRESFQCESFSERSKLLTRWNYEQAQDPYFPLRCVVEIGINKLRRDFINYFVGQELTTMNQLEFFFQKDASLAVQVEYLLRLYNVLELLVRSKGFLQLSHENLRLLMQGGLSYYKMHPASDHPHFSLSFPALKSSSVVKDVTSMHQPTEWKVALTTGKKEEKCTTIIELRRKPYLNTTASTCLEETAEKSFAPEQSYRLSVTDNTFVGMNLTDLDKEVVNYYMYQAVQCKVKVP